MGEKWLSATEQSFNPREGDGKVVQGTVVGVPSKWGVMCKGAANVQAFMPGDRVEYRSKSMGGKWLPGVVQSFNDQTNTYFLNLISGAQVPEATPQKLRKVAFQPGDKVESWSKSMGEKSLSATEQSFNPQTDTHCLNLIDGRQAFTAAPEKVRAARGKVTTTTATITTTTTTTVQPIVSIVPIAPIVKIVPIVPIAPIVPVINVPVVPLLKILI